MMDLNFSLWIFVHNNSPEKILESYLRQHIPITAAMGVKVEQVSENGIVLSAPFAPNINHKKTVFGGSLHAVATLACWSLLHMQLNEEIQIVISKSEIAYLAPVASDFEVECGMPSQIDWGRFTEALRRKGKGRICLQAKIVQQGKLCVDYSGVFVALRI